ncbi:hemolysin III family protein [Tyzzerella sp. OttesenSCG-928-J15]|nr:hemolysin III family protein [Tyzzerella sp. OttesenSCG-928-J15]
MQKVKDPISALTHFIGFLAAIPCTIMLVLKAKAEATPTHVTSMAIFGIALILLYAASFIYHTVNKSDKISAILRRIDHMMIFVLIAGTYTPVCMLPLRGAWGWTILILVWAIALAGILLKAFWIDAPRWLSSLIYVIMGWLVMIAFVPLINTVPRGGIALLVSGGVTYTLGAVIYALKKPKFNFKFFGFHELFHLFVMGGSAFHIVFMFKYMLAY